MPFESWTITNQMVGPIVDSLLGIKTPGTDWAKMQGGLVKAKLSRNLDSDKGREEYIPVRFIESTLKEAGKRSADTS